MKKTGLLIVLLVLLSVNIASAGNLVGKYCLYLKVEHSLEENQLSITAIDETNFSLNGTTTKTTISGVGSVTGTAAIVGEYIIVTLHKSHSDEHGMSVSTSNIKLGTSSLEGTYQSIIQNYHVVPGYHAEFENLAHELGTAKLSICDANLKTRCEINGGFWDEKYSECNYISEGVCKILGGQFDPCGTCRDLPPDTLCALMCIPYCAF